MNQYNRNPQKEMEWPSKILSLTFIYLTQVPCHLYSFHPLRHPNFPQHQTHPWRGRGGEKEKQADKCKQKIQKKQQVSE